MKLVLASWQGLKLFLKAMINDFVGVCCFNDNISVQMKCIRYSLRSVDADIMTVHGNFHIFSCRFTLQSLPPSSHTKFVYTTSSTRLQIMLCGRVTNLRHWICSLWETQKMLRNNWRNLFDIISQSSRLDLYFVSVIYFIFVMLCSSHSYSCYAKFARKIGWVWCKY